tara:strand:+ start:44 stop:277 length:234 start_codon:yes stop_codon:yes gene_type:complete
MSKELDEAVLRTKTCTHIINVLLSVYLVLDSYINDKKPSKHKTFKLMEEIKRIELDRLRAIRRVRKSIEQQKRKYEK